MTSVNIRELRDSKRLKELLREGKTIQLKERNRVIGRIIPENQQDETVEYPDFAGRAKAIFGNRVLNIVDDLIKDRGRY